MYLRTLNFDNLNNYNKIIILMRHSEANHNKYVDIEVNKAIKLNLCPIKAKEKELMNKKHINPSLSSNGIINAKKQISIIRRFININETIILCSPLLRTLQTANYFMNIPKKNIIQLNILLERRTKRPCDNFTLDTIDNNKEENNEQVFQRTLCFCNYISNLKSKFTVVITHKRFLIELAKNLNIFTNYGESYFKPGEFRVFVH